MLFLAIDALYKYSGYDRGCCKIIDWWVEPWGRSVTKSSEDNYQNKQSRCIYLRDISLHSHLDRQLSSLQHCGHLKGGRCCCAARLCRWLVAAPRRQGFTTNTTTTKGTETRVFCLLAACNNGISGCVIAMLNTNSDLFKVEYLETVMPLGCFVPCAPNELHFERFDSPETSQEYTHSRTHTLSAKYQFARSR